MNPSRPFIIRPVATSLLMIAIMLVVGVVRLLDNEVFNQRVWASYFLIGGIFVVAGTLISTKRHSRS